MRKLAYAVCSFALVIAGCGEGSTTGADPVSEVSEPVINGIPVSASNNPGVVALYDLEEQPYATFFCSGTVIRKNWILTARHCVTIDGTKHGPLFTRFSRFRVSRTINPGGMLPPSDAVGISHIVADAIPPLPVPPPPDDIALVRLQAPMSGPTLPLFDDTTNGMHNGLMYSTLIVQGFGMNVVCPGPHPTACCIGSGGSTDCGFGTLRKADLDVVASSASDFHLRPESHGYLPWEGDSGGPSLGNQSTVGPDLPLIGIHSDAWDPLTPGQLARDVSVSYWRSWIKRRQYVPGNTNNPNGDGRADIVLTGVSGWGSMPVARANSLGGFDVVNPSVATFPAIAATPGAKVLTGDFNGDGYSDVAAVGVSWWNTIAVALHGIGDGYTLVNEPIASFPGWAATAGAKPLRGDFDGDGYTDIALTGAPGWSSIPVALSAGNGTFVVRNHPLANFPIWAANAAAKPVSGDFNGDGRDDIALVGVAGWTTVPVAYGNLDGAFTVRNEALGQFPALSAVAGVKPLSGDFNGDGRDDIVLTGVNTWTKVPIAFGTVFGVAKFTFSHKNDTMIAARSTGVGNRIVSGDFNGDLKDDLAFTGSVGQNFIALARSNGDGSFAHSGVTATDPNFYIWASLSGAVALSGQDHR